MAGHILGKGICDPELAGQQSARVYDDMNGSARTKYFRSTKLKECFKICIRTLSLSTRVPLLMLDITQLCLSVDTAILDPNRTFDQEHPKTLNYFHFIQAMINNKMLYNQLFPSNLVNNTYQFCLINTTDCTREAQKSHSFM